MATDPEAPPYTESAAPAAGGGEKLTIVVDNDTPTDIATVPLKKQKVVSGRQSYQFRALYRKTMVYQKRQWFVNVCCVGLCPFMMVVIAWAVGAIVTMLIGISVTAVDITYCSNSDAAMNEFNLPFTANLTTNDTERNYFTAPTVSGGIRSPLVAGASQVS